MVLVSHGCSCHARIELHGAVQPQRGGCTTSCREHGHTYRSATEENLRRFPAPHAVEQLVDDVLGHFHLHGLQRRRSVAEVALWDSHKGNASGRQHHRRHGWCYGVSSLWRGERGLELAPGDVVKGSNAWR